MRRRLRGPGWGLPNFRVLDRIIASYCVDFLKADMQHIYRQITSLRGWQPVVITHRRENEALFPFPPKKVRVLSKHPLRFFRRLWHRQIRGRTVPPTLGEVKEFLYQVLRFKADVLHIYFGHMAVQWLPVIRACPVPVVVSFHGADAGVGVERDRLREVFRHAALVLARSEALLADLRALGCPPEKLRLSRTGVPLDFWSPPEVPRVVPPPDGEWRLVQVCRLVEKKGLAVTLRAFAGVAAEFPQARLTLVGDGPLREALGALARELGVADRVEFPGFLKPEEIRALLHGAHAFFHPSEVTADGNREGVPNSLLEAMATGLPALATHHGGIPEAVTDGESGLLVAEGDVAALTTALRRLLNDPALHARLSAGARTSVIEKFERAAQTAVLERCYDEALAPPPAAAGEGSP